MINIQEGKLNAVLARAASVKVDAWPSKYEILDEEGVFRLLHFQPIREERYQIPILIIFAFINRPYVLDLHPEMSVIQKYLNAGFAVYMIDWGYPMAADSYLDLDDYLDYIHRSLRRIIRSRHVEQAYIHGYCLGGTLSAVYAALKNNHIRGLVLQATPIDFNTDNLLAKWARSLNPDKFIEAYNIGTGSFLNTAFLLLNPVNLVLRKYTHFLQMTEKKSISDFLRMDRWIFDSPNIPGKTFQHFIKSWYHDNSLIQGKFRAMGERVDLSKITAPLLVLVAKYDHIAPPESQKVILNIASSQDKVAYEMAKGHIGMTTSRDSHKQFWPKVVRWLEQRAY